MDDALRQLLGPVSLQVIELLFDHGGQARYDVVGPRPEALEERSPTSHTQRIGARVSEAAPGQMQRGHGLPQRGTVARLRPPDPDPLQESDECRRFASER